MPILHSFKQNTPEWFKARLGIPTASEFDRIITATGKVSTQAPEYLHRLLAEWYLDEPVENFSNEWMDRGHEYEPEAMKAYSFMTGHTPTEIGFITTDDGLAGCSPDRLVGTDKCLELKCPLAHTQIGYLMGDLVSDKYRVQLQGQLWVSGRDTVDIYAYHPKLPPVLLTIGRDEKFLPLLGVAVRTFVDTMLKAREDLVKRFGEPERRKPEEDSLGVSDADVDRLLARAKITPGE